MSLQYQHLNMYQVGDAATAQDVLGANKIMV
jgi:hypothetical protein